LGGLPPAATGLWWTSWQKRQLVNFINANAPVLIKLSFRDSSNLLWSKCSFIYFSRYKEHELQSTNGYVFLGVALCWGLKMRCVCLCRKFHQSMFNLIKTKELISIKRIIFYKICFRTQCQNRWPVHSSKWTATLTFSCGSKQVSDFACLISFCVLLCFVLCIVILCVLLSFVFQNVLGICAGGTSLQYCLRRVCFWFYDIPFVGMKNPLKATDPLKWPLYFWP